MRTSRTFYLLLGIAALVLGGITQASAQDFTDTVRISDSTGFPGVCAIPCFELDKTINFYEAGSASAPGVCAPGEDTYAYTLFNPGTGTINIPITEFEISVDTSLVTGSGQFGDGIAPTALIPGTNILSWTFPDDSGCPGCLDAGKTSQTLYLCADGATTNPELRMDTVSTTAIILDEQGNCYVPAPAVATCDIVIDKKCCVSQGDNDEGTDSDSGHSDEKPGEGCMDFDDNSDTASSSSSDHSGSKSGSDSSGSNGQGSPFLDNCVAQAGDTITYGYLISNPNNEKLIDVVVDDDKLGVVSGANPKKLKPGKEKLFLESTTLFVTTTNTASVTGDLENSGDTCIGEDSVTVTIVP